MNKQWKQEMISQLNKGCARLHEKMYYNRQHSQKDINEANSIQMLIDFLQNIDAEKMTETDFERWFKIKCGKSSGLVSAIKNNSSVMKVVLKGVLVWNMCECARPLLSWLVDIDGSLGGGTHHHLGVNRSDIAKLETVVENIRQREGLLSLAIVSYPLKAIKGVL